MLGAKLIINRLNGSAILTRTFSSNLNDCAISENDELVVFSTLAPDSTLYGIRLSDGSEIMKIRDNAASTGLIRLDNENRKIQILERSGLGIKREFDFLGKPIEGRIEISRQQIDNFREQFLISAIVDLLQSDNKATVLATLESLKARLSTKKLKIDTDIAPILQNLYTSSEKKLMDLAFQCLVKLYEKKGVTKEESLGFLTDSLSRLPIDETWLYRMDTIARLDVESVLKYLPEIAEDSEIESQVE